MKHLPISLISIAVIIVGVTAPFIHKVLFPLNEYYISGIEAATEEPFGSIYVTGSIINAQGKFVTTCSSEYEEVYIRPYTIFMIPGKIIYVCASVKDNEVVGISRAGHPQKK
jgi:hypothetical protein